MLRQRMKEGDPLLRHPNQPTSSPIPSPISSTPGSPTFPASSVVLLQEPWAFSTKLDPAPLKTRADASQAVRINNAARIASLRFLQPRESLDDVVMNTVLAMLVNRDDRFEVVDTFMLDYVSRDAEIPDWFRQYHEVLRGRPNVLIPWCYRAHWVLFWYTSSGQITYYDSIPGYIPLATAEHVINRYLDMALGPETPRAPMALADGPVQNNNFDCGLFVLRYVDALTNSRVASPVLPSVEEHELRSHYRAVFLSASRE
ncbi:hypothetical protein ColTof4_14461 [Colletotrichum tofieldiae]|nr:hypothetical protein ColTof4_14461 [Colletotrichum tofieldiae]